MFLKVLRITGKTVACLILIAVLAILISGFSYIYDFKEGKPFEGKDIYNPYAEIDSMPDWKRANFHTHTRVSGLLNECEYTPAETLDAYKKLGYDIVTFSNHNQLTEHPYDSTLQVNVYEHGINIFQFHKLVFGSKNVDNFDHLLPIFLFQKQYQLDRLAKDADFIQLNHPCRVRGLKYDELKYLEGYQITELDVSMTTENEFWDHALSAGHYSFGLANDDLHYPDKSDKIGIRSNFLCVPTGFYEDLKDVLLKGGYYAMRIPDYGDGDWDKKIERNKHLPYVTSIGLRNDSTIYVSFSQRADSIRFIGQNHSNLLVMRDTTAAQYTMKREDPYARITAYFPEGEVIYSNPFARYNSTEASSPFRPVTHKVNLIFTILYNLFLLILCAGDLFLMYILFRPRR